MKSGDMKGGDMKGKNTEGDNTGGTVACLVSAYPKVSHTFIQREVAGLRALGLDVRTCAIRRPGPGDLTGPEERQAARATFHVLAAARNPFRLIGDHLALLARRPGGWLRALGLAVRTRPPGLRALVWQLFYLAEAGILARHLTRIRAVHLHIHFANAGCSVGMLASEMSGIPFSFTMHGPTEFFEADRWRLDEKIARARFVACISHFCRSQLMLFADRAHWPKLQIVHCAVDPARYDRPRPAPAKRLLFVGRLAAVKGVPVLLKALQALARAHPEAHLTLAGDGPDRRDLEALAQTLGIADRVRFAGTASQEEVAAHLAQSDVLVLPSFAEGLPVVLMEALASRVPVVATRIAGVAELVEDGVNGCLVAPGDAPGLGRALDGLLSDPARRAAMGDAGRRAVMADFDLRTETARLAGLIGTSQTETSSARAVRAASPASPATAT